MKKKVLRVVSFALCLSLLFAVAIPSMVSHADEIDLTEKIDAMGIESSKTVVQETDGSYTLDMEAWATGETANADVDIVLLLDRSNSMAGGDLSELKDCAKKVIDLIASTNTRTGGNHLRVGAVTFPAIGSADGLGASPLFYLVTVTEGNKGGYKSQINQLSIAGSLWFTPTGTALEQGRNMFDSKNSKKVIILISDGAPTVLITTGTLGATKGAFDVAQELKASGITIYTVGTGKAAVDENHYGEKAVSCIMTQGRMKAKAAVQNAARAYGSKTGNDFLSLGMDISSKLGDEGFDDIDLSEFQGNPDAQEIIRAARMMENRFLNVGVHAAGVVIADNGDVSDYVPLLYSSGKEQWATQCDMESVEGLGLLKMDFLGLKNMSVITAAEKGVVRTTGERLSLSGLPLNDPKVMRQIFQKGNTDNVFQFESDGMKRVLRDFSPETFEDLILLVAIFRPGPLQYIKGIVDVKRGLKPPK